MFGSGVALAATGTVLAIGSTGVDINGNNEGMDRVFYFDGCCNWNPFGQDIVGEGDDAKLDMHQVSLSDDGCCLAAGVSLLDNETGRCYLFDYDNGQWNQVVSLTAIDRASDRFSGSSSVSGDCSVAVFRAVEYDTSRPGYFRVYSYANREGLTSEKTSTYSTILQQE